MEPCWSSTTNTARSLDMRDELFRQELAQGVQPSDTIVGDFR